MSNKKGIFVNGSIRSAGVTFYTKKGQTIIRASQSRQPVRRTLAQFDIREGRAHANHLWQTVNPLGLITYAQFCRLVAKLPALYLTREEHSKGYTLLLPGIPVACGTLPDIQQRLGQVDGTAALLTDLDPTLLSPADRFTLVEVEQVWFGVQPRLAAATEEIAQPAFDRVEGRLALVGDRYGEADRGWTLVRRRHKLCSTQTVVTAATAYQAYLTEEARQRAASSYGGLTG